jgi:hypothetical protein
MFAFFTSDLLGLIRDDYPSGPRLRLRFFVAAALSRDLRVDPHRRSKSRHNMSSDAWREQVLPGACLVAIAISIFSHLLFRKWRGGVLEKDSELLPEIRMDWLWFPPHT